MGSGSKAIVFFLLTQMLCLVCQQRVTAQKPSAVWVPDLQNGYYQNPVIHADYSDPDVIRVSEDYYMTTSSFNYAPGLPILHSKDLVNWSLLSYALPALPPYDHFRSAQPGGGVWAPSIRHHNGLFYIYYPDPDFGIYLITAKDPAGPWSDPVLVEGGKGFIDPCPLWDDDGRVYLVHAYAGSRAGIKSIIVVKELNREGTRVINTGTIVYDGHEQDPTIEGPKFYKRRGYYYIFAPAGGVATGWQTVLRARHVLGPYERKVVMHQGSTNINGPHQGAWIDTPSGEDWFMHFQDKEAYGRVVHLQPMTWVNDWPVIGQDDDGDGIGEPVLRYRKPALRSGRTLVNPVEGDEFDGTTLSGAWQWQANPEAHWMFLNPTKGILRLYSQRNTSDSANLWMLPNVLSQKFPAPEFTATTQLSFHPNPKLQGERAGLIVTGRSYAYVGLEQRADGVYLIMSVCGSADKGNTEQVQDVVRMADTTVWLQVQVREGGMATFRYSLDGKQFKTLSPVFVARAGQWVGAKVGLFCTRAEQTNDAGYADIAWFRFSP